MTFRHFGILAVAGSVMCAAFGITTPAKASEIDPVPIFRESGIPSEGLPRIGHWIATESAVGDILPACSVTAAFRNGYALTLSARHDRDWSLTLRRADWRTGRFVSEAAHYWVDSESPQRVRARASRDGKSIILDVREAGWISGALRGGDRLSIALGTRVHRFPLTRIAQALDWSRACLPKAPPERQRIARGGLSQSQPTEGGLRRDTGAASWLRLASRTPARPELTAERQRSTPHVALPKPDKGGMAMDLMMSLIEATGLHDANLNSALSARRWGIATQATWETSTSFGAVRHYTAMTGDLYHIESRTLIYHEKRLCDGSLETGLLPSALVGLSGTYTRCSTPRGDMARLHFRLDLPSGETFLILIGGKTADGTSWPAISQQIAAEARRFAREDRS